MKLERRNNKSVCTACHDLQAMSDDPLLPAKARDYHLAARQPGHTCLSCHQGIAHGDDKSAPLRPENLPADAQ